MRKKIAIVEDDKAIAQMYKFKLENEGFEVDTASNGHDGFELVKNRKPHLVLLDLRMPHMNGDEMLERMRATEWGKNISVIILTNSSPTEIPKPVYKQPLNADRYIVKARRTPQQILEIVPETLSQRRAFGKQLSPQLLVRGMVKTGL